MNRRLNNANEKFPNIENSRIKIPRNLRISRNIYMSSSQKCLKYYHVRFPDLNPSNRRLRRIRASSSSFHIYPNIRIQEIAEFLGTHIRLLRRSVSRIRTSIDFDINSKARIYYIHIYFFSTSDRCIIEITSEMMSGEIA